MPIIRTSVGKSKDGKFVVTRTTITYIKPLAYYEAVLAGKAQEEDDAVELVALA
jgi:hypothetical protein